MEKNNTNKHFSNFYIAGFTFHEGCMVFSKLKIGTQLRLCREQENKFDPYAVAIYYKGYKLGYIPREMNESIAQFMDLGYTKIFDVRVQRITPEAHPEKQVGVVIFLREAESICCKE